MDCRPIGIFDSGLGGLTTVSALKKLMPNEDIVYFGDTSRVPYGTKSKETIKKYAKQDIRFLLSHDVKMIITACNTASTVLQNEDIDNLNVEYAAVIMPAVYEAVNKTYTKKIGIIGTNATIKSKAYEKALHEIDNAIQVYSNSCPLFVPLVENGFTSPDNQVTNLVAEQYLKPLLESNVDTLILGCTHYPIIKEIIKKIMGEKVTLIDSGQEVVKVCKKILEQKDMLNLSKKAGECHYYVSDSIEDFSSNAQMILCEPVIGKVEKIDIESY